MHQRLGHRRAATLGTSRPSTMRIVPRATLCAAASAAVRAAAAAAPPGAAVPTPTARGGRREPQHQNEDGEEEEQVPSTLSGLLTTFFSQASILGAAAAIAAAAAARLSRAEPFSPQEAALCLAAVALWCVCEWGIHRHLLHPLLEEDGEEEDEEGENAGGGGGGGGVVGGGGHDTTTKRRQKRQLGAVLEALRATHAEHHAKPYLHVSVDGGPLIAAFMTATGACWCLAFWLASAGGGGGGGGAGAGGAGALLSAAAAAATTTTAATTGLSSPFLPSALTAYWSAGLLYEFSHFAAHTRYVPKGRTWPARWLRGVRRHHILHHCRSEGHWLAFTVPSVDALFGTLPGRGQEGSWPAMTPMARRAAASWRGKGGGGGV